MQLDPFQLDRDIARAARAERKLSLRARTDPERARSLPSWYEGVRHIAGKTTFDEIGNLAVTDPMRSPLRRWVHRLAISRITESFQRDLEDAWLARGIRVEASGAVEYDARDVVRRLLLEREPGRCRTWLSALEAGSGPLRTAARELEAAACEIRVRLGADPAERIDREADRPDSAADFLTRTGDLTKVAVGDAEDLASLLPRLVGRDVAGEWPRRASPRWIADLFESTPLLEGVRFDSSEAPATLGGLSFARALASFGAEYRRAAASPDAPFVLAHDATELAPLRRGALFGALIFDTEFLRRRLGLSRDAARQTARTLTRSLLVHLRLTATWALLRRPFEPDSALEDAFHHALSFAPPRGLLLVLPRPHGLPRTQWLAVLAAGADRRELITRFDEDWFRNPHALRWLREHDGADLPGLADLSADASRFEGEPARLAAELEAVAS
jgi:hypothetical protein